MRTDHYALHGPHHDGELASVNYVSTGRHRMRWGDQIEYAAEAGPDDFICVVPCVPHQEINASPTDPLTFALVRSDQDAVVVRFEIAAAEPPEDVRWIDDIHQA